LDYNQEQPERYALNGQLYPITSKYYTSIIYYLTLVDYTTDVGFMFEDKKKQQKFFLLIKLQSKTSARKEPTRNSST
jgi:hypothetical protein